MHIGEEPFEFGICDTIQSGAEIKVEITEEEGSLIRPIHHFNHDMKTENCYEMDTVDGMDEENDFEVDYIASNIDGSAIKIEVREEDSS